jgi:hypothetical protein
MLIILDLRILRPRTSSTLIENNIQNDPTVIAPNFPVTPDSELQTEINRQWRKKDEALLNYRYTMKIKAIM